MTAPIIAAGRGMDHDGCMAPPGLLAPALPVDAGQGGGHPRRTA